MGYIDTTYDRNKKTNQTMRIFDWKYWNTVYGLKTAGGLMHLCLRTSASQQLESINPRVHLLLDKMAAMSQTTFSNAFS